MKYAQSMELAVEKNLDLFMDKTGCYFSFVSNGTSSAKKISSEKNVIHKFCLTTETVDTWGMGGTNLHGYQ